MTIIDTVPPTALDAARLGLWWQEVDDVVRVVVPRPNWRVRLVSSRLRLAMVAVLVYTAFWIAFVLLSGWVPRTAPPSQWWMLAVGGLLIGVTWLLLRCPPPIVFVLSPKTLRVEEGAGRLMSIELPRDHVSSIDYIPQNHSVHVVCDDRDALELHVTDRPDVDTWIAEHLTDALKRHPMPLLVSAG